MADKTWDGTDSGNEGDYSVADNWVASGVPTAADDVSLQYTSTQAINAGLNQSAVAIADFIVNAGYTGSIGDETVAGTPTYLQIDPDYFQFAGTGTSYIDLGSAAIDVEIQNTKSAASGKRGLYLKGSAIDDLSVIGGDVGVSYFHDETSTVTDAFVSRQGDLLIGRGTTLTNGTINGGTLTVHCGATLLTCHEGTLITEHTGAITSIDVYGGEARLNSTGTITNLTIDGGTVDMTYSNLPRTITNLIMYPDSTLIYDDNIVTITNLFNGGVGEAVNVSMTKA
jgi:hypothetical protein